MSHSRSGSHTGQGHIQDKVRVGQGLTGGQGHTVGQGHTQDRVRGGQGLTGGQGHIQEARMTQ